MNEYICGWKQSQIAQNTMEEGVIYEYKEDSTWVINWSIAVQVSSRSVIEKLLSFINFHKNVKDFLGYSCHAHCNKRTNNTREHNAKNMVKSGKKGPCIATNYEQASRELIHIAILYSKVIQHAFVMTQNDLDNI